MTDLATGPSGFFLGGMAGGTPNTVSFVNAAAGMNEEAAGRMPAPRPGILPGAICNNIMC
jgi:hypothetical protein